MSLLWTFTSFTVQKFFVNIGSKVGQFTQVPTIFVVHMHSLWFTRTNFPQTIFEPGNRDFFSLFTTIFVKSQKLLKSGWRFIRFRLPNWTKFRSLRQATNIYLGHHSLQIDFSLLNIDLYFSYDWLSASDNGYNDLYQMVTR